jgi:hypothetical protein
MAGPQNWCRESAKELGLGLGYSEAALDDAFVTQPRNASNKVPLAGRRATRKVPNWHSYTRARGSGARPPAMAQTSLGMMLLTNTRGPRHCLMSRDESGRAIRPWEEYSD